MGIGAKTGGRCVADPRDARSENDY